MSTHLQGDEEKEGVRPLIPLAILFFPSVLLSLFFNLYLHRRRRLRPSVIFQIIAAYELALASIWFIVEPHAQAFNALMNFDGFGEVWPKLVPLVVLVYLMVAGVLGGFWVLIEKRQLKREPHRRELVGNWMHQFKYRRTPRELALRKKRIKQLKAGVLVDEERVPLGIDESNGDKIAYRYYDEAVKHTLISGASGSGKTLFSMLSLIRGDIENQVPTFIIDFKRDPELASKVATWTKDNGGEFYHFVNGSPDTYDIPNSQGQCFYDPLAAGGPTAKADMVLGMREYDTASAVYKAAMTQLLQVLFQMLAQADRSKTNSVKWTEGGISQLASVASEVGFEDLVSAIPEHSEIAADAAAVSNAIRSKSSQLRHALDELAGQIRTIAVSEYGRWLKPKNAPGERRIDLFDLSTKPGSVVLFSLNSDSEPDFARYVGSLILADITNVSARRRNENLNNIVSVYVDEFQIVPPTSVTSLLEKSRASSMGLTLAQQSFEQIVSSAPANGEAYLLSILDTCSNFIIHNGATEDSAERLSKILGKHKVTKYKSSNKNESFFLSFNWKNKREALISTSDEEEWVFSPREFMTLMSPSEGNGYKATAVLVNKTSSDPDFSLAEGAVARKIWMIPPDYQLRKYYQPNRVSAPPMAVTDKHVEEPEEQFIAPPDAGAELLRRRRAQKELEAEALSGPELTYEEPIEEEEGGWEFEVIEEDQELKSTVEELDSSREPADATSEPRMKPSPKTEAQRPRGKSSFFSTDSPVGLPTPQPRPSRGEKKEDSSDVPLSLPPLPPSTAKVAESKGDLPVSLPPLAKRSDSVEDDTEGETPLPKL